MTVPPMKSGIPRPPPRFLASWLGAGLLLLALSLPGAVIRSPLGASESDYGRLPLWFEPNQGQVDAEVRFVARGPNFGFYLGSIDSTIVLRRSREPDSPARVVRVHLDSASPASTVRGLQPFSGRINYFLGQNPAGWATEIPTFAQVEVQSVYPGISLLYYGSDQQLEYDFVVGPQANPDLIAFRYDGVDALELNASGDLILKTGKEELTQRRPIAYQTREGVRQPVPAAYVLGLDRKVRFRLGPYDRDQPVVIDPILSYATYLGGSRGDIAHVIKVDAAGSAYVAGETMSILTNLTASATNFSGGRGLTNDGFVAKFSPAGDQLVYLTYLGGSGNDAVLGMALDASGSVYLTGYTDSTNFPTVNAFQTTLKGTNEPRLKLYKQEAFVAKLDAAGSSLVYCSYLGGPESEVGVAIEVDAGGNAYIVGHSSSSNDFPVTAPIPSGATNHGAFDVFYGKVNPAGNSLLFLNYLGGCTNDFAKGLALAPGGVMWIAGNTLSTNFPVTPDALQTNYLGGGDIFLTKVDTASGAVVYSTFLGGHGSDKVSRIVADGSGNVYLTGGASSADFPLVSSGLNHGGIFKSVDGAATWTASSDGLLHNEVLSLAIDPVSPAVIYAGTVRGVFKSSDGGGTWSSASSGLSESTVNALVLDPNLPSTLYAGTLGGIFKSTDGAGSWSLSLSNLASFSVASLLAVDSSVIYAGTAGGLYRTTNAGMTWGSARLSGAINALARDPSGLGKKIYAGATVGVFNSTNGFVNWRARVLGLTSRNVRALAIDPVDPQIVFAGATNGLFRSLNGGTNWLAVNTGLGNSNIMVNALAIDPNTPATVYAGTFRGVFKSIDRGTNWLVMTNGLTTARVQALVLRPDDSTSLFAGTRGTNNAGSNDVFVVKMNASGSGLDYSIIFGGKGDEQGNDLALDSDGNVHVVGMTLSTNLAAILSPSIRQSTNSGRSDAFVAQVRADGSGLDYLFFLGGKQDDFAYGVAVDSSGSTYVVGTTASTNFVSALVSTNAVASFRSRYAGNPDDGFLVKFLAPPVLSAQPVAEGVLLRWRSFPQQFRLEASDTFSNSRWIPVAQPVVTRDGWNEVRVPDASSCHFFRLTR